MMNPSTMGILGAVIGILGGGVGTYFSIRNTAGPRERAFAIRASVLGWTALTAFLVGLWLTPMAYRPLLWAPYLLLLPVAIHAWNRRQDRIRSEEAAGP